MRLEALRWLEANTEPMCARRLLLAGLGALVVIAATGFALARVSDDGGRRVVTAGADTSRDETTTSTRDRVLTSPAPSTTSPSGTPAESTSPRSSELPSAPTAEPGPTSAPAPAPLASADACGGDAPVLDRRGVWITRDGAAERVLDGRPESMHWSRDGRHLAALVDLEGELALDVVNVTTGQVTRLATESGLAVPAWTADGRLLVIEGDEVRAVAPATGAATVVHRGHAGAMAVAAGTQTAIVRDGTNLIQIELASGASTTIASSPGLSTPIAVSRDDRYVAYADHPPNQPKTLMTMGIDGDDAVDHGAASAVRSAAWTANGSAVVWDVVEASGSPAVWSTSPIAAGHSVVSARASGATLTSGGVVVFEDLDAGAVAAAAIDGGSRRQLAAAANIPAAGGSTIAYAKQGAVCAGDASDSAARAATPAAGTHTSLLAVSLDGRSIAITTL